jgi:hypothetical protein
LVAAVALVWLDLVDGQDLAGREVGDGDAAVVGEREDACAGVRGADSEVVDAAGAADGHPAFGVEPVIAEAVVALAALAGWCGFRSGAVGIAGSSSVSGAVRAAFVVMGAELVKLALQIRGAAGWWPGL